MAPAGAETRQDAFCGSGSRCCAPRAPARCSADWREDRGQTTYIQRVSGRIGKFIIVLPFSPNLSLPERRQVARVFRSKVIPRGTRRKETKRSTHVPPTKPGRVACVGSCSSKLTSRAGIVLVVGVERWNSGALWMRSTRAAGESEPRS